MSVINTNYLALVSQNNLTKSQNALGTAIERLSSGLRINSAKDDAAGQAIANRFTANIKGLTQATRNANDGISIAQTTEGALNEINNNLQRVRELSVQAANGTNSGSDLVSIQEEINQRLQEIDRISRETDFNGVKVLASDNQLRIQVGANDNEVISISLKEINSSQLGLDTFTVVGSKSATRDDLIKLGNLEEVETTDGVTEYARFANPRATGANVLATAANDDAVTVGGKTFTFDTGNYALTESLSTNEIAARLTPTSGYNLVTYTDDSATTSTTIRVDSQGNITNEAGQALHFDDAAGTFKLADETDPQSTIADVVGNMATDDTITDGNAVYADDGAATTTYSAAEFADYVGNRSFTFSADSGGSYTVSADGLVSDADGKTVYVTDAALGTLGTAKGAAVDQYFVQENGTVLDANDKTVYVEKGVLTIAPESKATAGSLDVLDTALNIVDSLRSDLGAIQNRFQSTIANLSNTVNNLSAARSRIEDADYAVEVSNMTRAQILQQAGTSVLAQANQVPQGVLSLLR